MVHSFPMSSSQLDHPALRALTSLSRRDADAVRATVRGAAAGHTVEEHDDYDGYLSLLITPVEDVSPSFVVAGRTGAVDVAEIRGDEMMSCGTYPSIGAAMIVLRPKLERDTGFPTGLVGSQPGQRFRPFVPRATDGTEKR